MRGKRSLCTSVETWELGGKTAEGESVGGGGGGEGMWRGTDEGGALYHAHTLVDVIMTRCSIVIWLHCQRHIHSSEAHHSAAAYDRVMRNSAVLSGACCAVGWFAPVHVPHADGGHILKGHAYDWCCKQESVCDHHLLLRAPIVHGQQK